MRCKHWPLSVATHSPSNGIYHEDGDVDDIDWYRMMTMSIAVMIMMHPHCETKM